MLCVRCTASDVRHSSPSGIFEDSEGGGGCIMNFLWRICISRTFKGIKTQTFQGTLWCFRGTALSSGSFPEFFASYIHSNDNILCSDYRFDSINSRFTKYFLETCRDIATSSWLSPDQQILIITGVHRHVPRPAFSGGGGGAKLILSILCRDTC